MVDDNAALAEMLSLVLRNEGFDPIWCAHGYLVLDTYRDARPDLVLLDLMLPGKDGMAICREIRSESVVPIVMLTARSDTTDVVAGLDAGADDYLAKPFHAKELIARIKTRLRHSPVVNDDMVRIGDLVIDVAGHTVKRNGALSIQLHAAGVRPAPDPGSAATTGLQPHDAPRTGLALPVSCRHPARQRPHPASPLQDRTDTRRTPRSW